MDRAGGTGGAGGTDIATIFTLCSHYILLFGLFIFTNFTTKIHKTIFVSKKNTYVCIYYQNPTKICTDALKIRPQKGQ